MSTRSIWARLRERESPGDAEEDSGAPAALGAVPEPGPPAFVTVGQAADALGISQNTARRWADEGRIRSVRTPGGHRRLRRSDVTRLVSRSCLRSRAAPLPSRPAPRCATLIEHHGTATVRAVTDAMYEPQSPGWWAGDEAALLTVAWMAQLAGACASGNYAIVVDATRRHMDRARLGGASPAESYVAVEQVMYALVGLARDDPQGRAEAETLQRAGAATLRVLLEELRIQLRAAGGPSRSPARQ